MKKNSISLIVVLMTLALLGVMAMQLYFLRQSYQLKTQLFDQSVHEAMNNVVAKLAKLDANNFLTNKVQPAQKPVKLQFVKRKKNPLKEKKIAEEAYAALLRKEQRKADSIFALRDSLFRKRNPNAIAFNGAVTAADLRDMDYRLQVDIIQFEDAWGQVHQQARQTLSGALPAPSVPRPINAGGNTLKPDSVRQYIIFDPHMGPQIVTYPKPKLVHITPSKKMLTEEVKQVKAYFEAAPKNKDVFKDLYTEYQQVYVPLSQRIHPLILDSMLRNELRSRSINSNYEYKVTSAKRDSLIFIRASSKTEFLPYNSYETPLFPKDMIRDAGLLTVTFPDKNNIILSNLTAMMGLSGGLLLILLFCFGYTLHSILKQKKLSEMKTDFINNMTHEFKTPVATIMLASEALKDPELTSDRSRIERLANVIYDENVRLGNHIERVLHIAKIDQDDLKLEHKEVEMHDLLTAVIDSMSLQLEKKNAHLDLQLHAGRSTVWGDELHLSNVIFNLIDNANKYSKENPEIKITTSNTGKNLVIKVADKGIGMSRDQQSKIFDQFYRIPTGNLHDVKGFGLGLSYVSNMVKRMHGHIHVKSEKDKGSEFEVILPLAG